MNGLLLTKCLRCNGAMAYNKYYGSHGEFWGWKCLICGEIVDPVILNNRQSMGADQEINIRKEKR